MKLFNSMTMKKEEFIAKVLDEIARRDKNV